MTVERAVEAGASAGGNLRPDAIDPPKRFRSWVEDYHAPAVQPIDPHAFAFRRQQRALTARAAKATSKPTKLAGGASLYFMHRDLAEAQQTQARLSDPVLAAQLHLQRRGYIVTAAQVIDPEQRGWRVGGRSAPLDDTDLIALAQSLGMSAAVPTLSPPAPGITHV
jgi:hypothetical protein